MNSDYIPRLRRELLRAGARDPARWRRPRLARGLRPIASATAFAAVALIALAIVLSLTDGRSNERAAEQPADARVFNFRLEPSGARAAEQSAQVMRARLAAAGVGDARVSVAPSGGLTISAPAAARAEVTALSQTGRLAVYDWERSVLGPRGKPARTDESVTGGPDAGRSGAITKAEAEARAAGVPGARVVRAEDGAGDRWFVLGGKPALTNAHLQRAEAAVDDKVGEPTVAIELTGDGERRFGALTRELAHRGSKTAAAGVEEMEAHQHLAIVIDDRIANVPFIHFREVPDGIDGSEGLHILGDLTTQTARQTAALLSAGPLPATLLLESEDATGG